MRSQYISATGLALVVASSMTVQAADLGGYESFKDAPPPAPRFTWSGVYGGLNAGGGWGKSKVTESGSFFTDDLVGNYASYNVNGFIGGLQAGMNRQYGNWVLGGEFNLSGANIDGSSGNCEFTGPSGGPFNVAQTCSTTVNWVASGLFKAGYAWNRWLTYGTVGWAVAGIDHKASYTDDDMSFAGAENETADGIAFGGGVEYAFTNDMSFGVEYTRMNLKADGDGFLPLSTGSRDVDLNVVRAKLNFKLGPGSKLW